LPFWLTRFSTFSEVSASTLSATDFELPFLPLSICNTVQLYPLDNRLGSATSAAEFYQQKPLKLQIETLTTINDTAKLHCSISACGPGGGLVHHFRLLSGWQYAAASSRIFLSSSPRSYRHDCPTSGLCRTKSIVGTVSACLCAPSCLTGSTP
jgi:hypothetical protein